MLKQLFIFFLVLLSYTCTSYAAPDRWVIQVAGEAEKTIINNVKTKASAQQETSDLSIEEAEKLLDYRQYKRVIQAMRLQLDTNDKNTAAWSLLIRALEGNGDTQAANQAQKKLKALGGEHPWRVMVQLAAFVDSNVVIAPSIILLPAQDQGDIGAKASLMLAGRVMSFEHGHTSAWFRYDDMLYQDLNNFALRKIRGGFIHHIDIKNGGEIWANLSSEYATLGDVGFYSGFSTGSGLTMPLNEKWLAKLSITGGHRTFNNNFSGFSAWRWQAKSTLAHHTDNWNAGLQLQFSNENTQQTEEAHRNIAVKLSGSYKLTQLFNDDLWLLASLHASRLDYHNLDSRNFLISPLLRQDKLISSKISLEWRRNQTLWGANTMEKWYLLAGWSDTRSNMDKNSVINPIQSRVWNRWWSELGVTWTY